ncbi:MAG: hypothetical protein IT480_06485 [Gammaproteobacteria bacterium]|nr:hypothetical protein [Gammaproteobacteria bacterium]
MAFTAKCVAEGQLPSSAGDLYTVPAATRCYVKRIKCVNTNATSQTVVIYKRTDGTNDRIIGRAVLAQWETFAVGQEIVEAGDKIRGVTTTASAVDYTVDGVEEG